MKKLYRKNRESFIESIDTTTEVNGLEDILKMYEGNSILSNIHIDNTKIYMNGLPDLWNGISYKVLADFDGNKNQCIGFTNFYENVSI